MRRVPRGGRRKRLRNKHVEDWRNRVSFFKPDHNRTHRRFKQAGVTIQIKHQVTICGGIYGVTMTIMR